MIDGWDKMMNGDCNKKKNTLERIIHHAEKERKSCTHAFRVEIKKFKQGLIGLYIIVVVVIFIAEANKKKHVHAKDNKKKDFFCFKYINESVHARLQIYLF